MTRKYAVILGNLGNTCDRFCSGYKDNPSTMDMLEKALAIPYVEGIELVGTWDISPENVGITIDTGHAFNAGEVVAESIVWASRTGNRLMHMHFNDNFTVWDDDMIVGSIHTIGYLEILYWLDRCGYDGYLSMDQYPYREDAAAAICESIQWLVSFSKLLETHRNTFDELIMEGNAVQTSHFLRSILL